MQVRQGESKKDSTDMESKSQMIAKVLGILSETHRNKDWVLKEIQRHHLKLPLTGNGNLVMNSFELLNLCPDWFVTNLYKALTGQQVEGFEDALSSTRTYHWLFTDIIGATNPTTPTREQVRKIVVLNELITRTEVFRNRDSSTVILPVGDGVAVGFRDSLEDPLQLAIQIHKALHRYNQSRNEDPKDKLKIRIGIDMGPVYFVKDLNGKDNVWGPGIILTRRVMDLCGEMNIFASSRIAKELIPLLPEYSRILHPIGNFSIKHGEELEIYNIYGEGFGNKAFPKKKKVHENDEETDSAKHFAFNEIGIALEILNPKNDLTRHTVFWDVVNIAKKSKTNIYYFIDGDSPKEFPDLNVKIRDDSNNYFEILAVNANSPYHKQFTVQLKRPILPNKRKLLYMSYDWEEPERTYFYRLPADCKRLTLSLVAPKGHDVKPKIYRVDQTSGTKTEEKIAMPAGSGGNNKQGIITWSKDNLLAGDAYQFDW